MGSVASQASTILVSKSVGVVGGTVGTWPIFIGRRLETPDAQIIIFGTGGQAPNPRWLLDFPTFQVMVRGDIDGYAAAETKIQAVKDALFGIDPYVFGDGDRWSGVTMLGDIAFLRYDDKSRPMFVCNFRVIKEPADSVATAREPL